LEGFAQYLISVNIVTLSQLFVLMFPLVVFCSLMNVVSLYSAKYGCLALGRRPYLYIFGWLGVSVHELGHLVFAVLMNHRIDEVALFTPDSEHGLGYIRHSYDRYSIYQNLGNLFIGLGPILLGILLLHGLSSMLFGFSVAKTSTFAITSNAMLNLAVVESVIMPNLWDNILRFAYLVLYSDSSTWWKVALLLYCLCAIGGALTLSVSDILGAGKGFVAFVFVLLTLNMLTLWIGDFTRNAFSFVSYYFSWFYFLVLLCMFVNVCFVLLMFCVYRGKAAIVSYRN